MKVKNTTITSPYALYTICLVMKDMTKEDNCT